MADLSNDKFALKKDYFLLALANRLMKVFYLDIKLKMLTLYKCIFRFSILYFFQIESCNTGILWFDLFRENLKGGN